MLRTFCTGVAALAFAASLSAAPEIEVDIAKQTGTINRKLAGVSQGGNAGSFFKPAIRKGLEGQPLPLVRIEMITNSRPHALYDASTGKFNWTKLDEEIEAVRKAGGESSGLHAAEGLPGLRGILRRNRPPREYRPEIWRQILGVLE